MKHPVLYLYNLFAGRCQHCNGKKEAYRQDDWCPRCGKESLQIKERKLGQRTRKKFLIGLLPDGFTEEVYRGDRYWSIQVKGKYLPDKEWNILFVNLCEEFGEHLLEVYSLSPNGSHFIVYLRNDLK